MHAQLTQSVADAQRFDGRPDRPLAGQSDAVSFSELLRPTEGATRLGVSRHRQMALTGPAFPEHRIDSSSRRDRTDGEVSRLRAEPDRDGASAQSDGKWSTPHANAPACAVDSEQEPVALHSSTEARSDDPENEAECSLPDEPDPDSAAPAEAAVLPLTIPALPSGPSVASDGGLDPDALTVAATPAAHEPIGPVPPDAADASPSDVSADGAPMRASVLTAAEGLSSRPSSLLVPQGVLADTSEVAATPGVANTASAAPIAAGLAGAELAGAAGQSPTPPGAARALLASPAQTQADATAAPSPVAIAGAPGAGDAGAGDPDSAGQGFSSEAGPHAPLAARATAEVRPLATKPLAAQVAPHLSKAAKAGLTRIEITLEPASLGRVEVRLDFGRNGGINALFVAETREALDALRADARTLERALSEAGIEADSASLGFSLREQGAGTGGAFPAAFTRRDNPSGISAEPAPDQTSGSTAASPMPPAGERRLDIRA